MCNDIPGQNPWLNLRTILAMVVVAVTTISCGGGGDSAAPAPLNSTGIYYGVTPGVTPRNYPSIIIRPSGDFWVFNEDGYGYRGFGYGALAEGGTTFESTRYTYLSSETSTVSGNIKGSFRAGLSLSGTISYPSLGQELGFNADYLNLAEFSVEALARSWVARDDAGTGYNLTITADGSLVATSDSSSCSFAGTIGRADAGLGAAPVSVQTNENCRLASKRLSGMIFTTTSSSWTDIWVGLALPDRQDGIMLYVRQCLPGETGFGYCDP